MPVSVYCTFSLWAKKIRWKTDRGCFRDNLCKGHKRITYASEKKQGLFHSSNITAVGITCLLQLSHLPPMAYPHHSHISYWKDGLTFSSLSISTIWHLHFYSHQISVTHGAPWWYRYLIWVILRGSWVNTGQELCGLVPYLIPCCPGSKSTLSCPWVHFHCLKHGCFPPVGSINFAWPGCSLHKLAISAGKR